MLSLDFLDVGKRNVLPGCAVRVLGRFIGCGSLRKDLRRICIFSLIGGKIGESGACGRCGCRAKGL